jgi:hypothetical protein
MSAGIDPGDSDRQFRLHPRLSAFSQYLSSRDLHQQREFVSQSPERCVRITGVTAICNGKQTGAQSSPPISLRSSLCTI